MAAKAGGSSLKDFCNKCNPNGAQIPDNFINKDENLKPFLLSSLRPPKIVASHLYVGDQPLIDLIRHGAAKETLIIYIYRDETDRLMSAIKNVVKQRLCSKGFAFRKAFSNLSRQTFGLQDSSKQCIFDEEPFVREVIENRVVEVGYSIPTQLTCNLWNEIDETGPTILFLHYSQADALQAKLASQYCPGVRPVRTNVDTKDRSKAYVVRSAREGEIPLDDWIAAKRSTLEFALKLSGGSCKHRTRTMEDALRSCPSHAIRVYPTDFSFRF
jgi:hypothetical protein